MERAVGDVGAAMHNEGYDLVILFDCLHDMGDPAGTAKHVVSTLKADGTWMSPMT